MAKSKKPFKKIKKQSKEEEAENSDGVWGVIRDLLNLASSFLPPI